MMTEAQRDKALSLAAKYGARLEDCSTMMGCLGLPSGWLSLAIPRGDGRWLSFGVDPQGRASS